MIIWFILKVLKICTSNLSKCPQDIKDQAYKSLVRPHLEYASAVWDPYRQCHIDKIEMVQRKAARFVTNTYSREPGTVTNILQSLGWPTLETRRKGARLILLYKILHGEARSATQTRQHHKDRLLPQHINGCLQTQLDSKDHHRLEAAPRDGHPSTLNWSLPGEGVGVHGVRGKEDMFLSCFNLFLTCVCWLACKYIYTKNPDCRLST